MTNGRYDCVIRTCKHTLIGPSNPVSCSYLPRINHNLKLTFMGRRLLEDYLSLTKLIWARIFLYVLIIAFCSVAISTLTWLQHSVWLAQPCSDLISGKLVCPIHTRSCFDQITNRFNQCSVSSSTNNSKESDWKMDTTSASHNQNGSMNENGFIWADV